MLISFILFIFLSFLTSQVSASAIPIDVHFYPVLEYLYKNYPPKVYYQVHHALSKYFQPLLTASSAFQTIQTSKQSEKESFLFFFAETLENSGIPLNIQAHLSRLEKSLNLAGSLSFFLRLIEWPQCSPNIAGKYNTENCLAAFSYRLQIVENTLKVMKSSTFLESTDKSSTIRIIEQDALSYLEYIRSNHPSVFPDSEVLACKIFQGLILRSFSFGEGALQSRLLSHNYDIILKDRFPPFSPASNNIFGLALSLVWHHRYRSFGHFPLEDISNYNIRYNQLTQSSAPTILKDSIIQKIDKAEIEIYNFEGDLLAQLNFLVPVPLFLCRQNLDLLHYTLRLVNFIHSFYGNCRRIQLYYKLSEPLILSIKSALFKDLNDFKSRQYAGLDTKAVDTWMHLMLAHLETDIPTFIPTDTDILCNSHDYLIALVRFYSSIDNLTIRSKLEQFLLQVIPGSIH